MYYCGMCYLMSWALKELILCPPFVSMLYYQNVWASSIYLSNTHIVYYMSLLNLTHVMQLNKVPIGEMKLTDLASCKPPLNKHTPSPGSHFGL